MNAYILDNDFLYDDTHIKIGGLETYIRCLYTVLMEQGYNVTVFQYSNIFFDKIVDEIHVIGVGGAKSCRDILKFIDKCSPEYKNDLLIFATDLLIEKNKFSKVIAIQHGIAFDVEKQEIASNVENVFSILKGAGRAIKKFNRYKHCNNLVCVDYNFLNWYRTQVNHINGRVCVIPNFARMPLESRKHHDSLSIGFARRFVQYRGTRLFSEAISQVIELYPSLSITIAGTGPDENWMREKLKKYTQVKFTAYSPDESVEFNQQFDIAVVPSIGSEGTSLSLLEAMSAGCAVIATNVGGMTNIILDEYNGLIINPEVTELRDAIIRLIEDSNLREYLSQNAQETVQKSFSFEKWKNSWIKVIQSIKKE